MATEEGMDKHEVVIEQELMRRVIVQVLRNQQHIIMVSPVNMGLAEDPYTHRARLALDTGSLLAELED